VANAADGLSWLSTNVPSTDASGKALYAWEYKGDSEDKGVRQKPLADRKSTSR